MSNITQINGYQITAESASYAVTASYITSPSYVDNLITVGLPGSNTNYNSIKTAVDSILDASQNNTYTVRVYPGIYIEDPMVVPEWVAVKGDSSISTVVSASNPSASLFTMSDQSMIIDMQVQGCTAPGVAAVYYSSPTTPQTYAISYVENVRFGTNYTNAKVEGTGSGNCIMQCSNVKYGGFTEGTSSFNTGFYVTRNGSGVGRMQLRNVTSTNGGIAGSDPNQIFALADAPGCTFIVNGCLLTRATGAATGTGFKVYNGGSLRLTGVNFQRWTTGIWAPQTGSAPSIDAIALNFENCTTDVLIEHTGSTGKVQGTDTFLKTNIALNAPLYEVGQDPRKITVGKKGADFTSISASVAYITDSDENNRYVIEVGPGQFVEKEINLTGKPYVSIVGSSIQTTQIFPSSSNQHLIKMGINNEISFLSLTNSPVGYSALYVDDVGDYAQAHKVSFYDCDTCLTVISRTQDTNFYGEYLDFNGVYSTGSYVSSSNGFRALTSIENYYQFPTGSTGLIANYGVGGTTEIDLYTGALNGEGSDDPTSIAILLENGADLQSTGFDIPNWGTAIKIPSNNSASFNIVGTMIHDSVNYDFEILHPSASCRYQGTSDHSKINNVSSNFFWAFLDETDGEFDITRKISVTFDDGTHTDASTLIFYGSPMGVIEGGTITISGSLTITTAAGYGYLHNSGSTTFQRIDWADSNLTLPPNADSYIYIDETATLSYATLQPSNTQNIILGRVVTNDTGIELIDNSRYAAEHMSNALSTFNRNALGPVFDDGCIVSEDVTPFKLDVTAGIFYFGENQYDPTGGSAITFTRYYQSGSGAFGWNKTSTDLVPSTQYNSGSALIAMSSSYYTKHTLYTVGEGPDEEYFLVVGQNQYATLVEAENDGLPTPPTYFTDGVVSLAAIYVQSGSANITQFQDIRPIIGFRAAGVNASSIHGNLLGLNADDHQQYLLVDGTRAMSGDLNLNSNDITNVATINATSITSSLLGTASYANSSLTSSYAGFALTASYAMNGGVSGNAFPYSGSAVITGSLIVTSSNLPGINTATGTLKRSSQLASIDWETMTLGDGTATYIAWSDNQIFDGSSNPSIFWGTRNLYYSDGTTTSVDWELGQISDTTAKPSIYWNARELYDAGPSISVNWNSRQLIDSGNNIILDWENATFAGSITNAVSASYAATASQSVTSSYAITASYALNGGGGTTFPYSGSAVITGSLTIYNSGSSTTPLIKVQGGSGELFSVYDTFSGSLFSVNNQTGNPILEVTSDNNIYFGKPGYQAILTTQETIVTASGQFTVYSIPTASYDGAWFEYVIKSGSAAKAGQITAVWSGSQVNYSETSTTAFGNVSGLSFGVFRVGGNFALTGSATTGGWTMKTIIRSI